MTKARIKKYLFTSFRCYIFIALFGFPISLASSNMSTLKSIVILACVFVAIGSSFYLLEYQNTDKDV